MDAIILSDILPEIVKRILAVSDPRQIILFGSYARGDFDQDSDLDLLVIEDQIDSINAETKRIYEVLGEVDVPVDVIVASSSYVKRYGDLIGSVIRPALREGKVIYAR